MQFPPVDAEALRREAERILSQPRYRTDPTTGERLQEWLARALEQLVRLFSWLADLVGSPLLASIVLLVIVTATAVAVTRRLGKRRVSEMEQRIRREHELARGRDPEELEREAGRAAAAGDYSGAVRLLFRAGLLRLDDQHRIRYTPGATSGQIADHLRSPEFEVLARRFDEIVYGGAPAGSADVAAAIAGWRRLLVTEPVP
jgi:hypothetical protein